MQKFVTHLWFDTQAEEATRFYTSIFRNSRVGAVSRYGKEGAQVSGQKEGAVMSVDFFLDGQRFMAINGGPMFQLSEAVSIIVLVKDQAELDDVWEKLPAGGGKEQACGWLKDRFGLSWQVIPEGFEKMMADPDKARAERAMAAVFKMVKLDIATIERAYAGK